VTLEPSASRNRACNSSLGNPKTSSPFGRRMSTALRSAHRRLSRWQEVLRTISRTRSPTPLSAVRTEPTRSNRRPARGVAAAERRLRLVDRDRRVDVWHPATSERRLAPSRCAAHARMPQQSAGIRAHTMQAPLDRQGAVGGRTGAVALRQAVQSQAGQPPRSPRDRLDAPWRSSSVRASREGTLLRRIDNHCVEPSDLGDEHLPRNAPLRPCGGRSDATLSANRGWRTSLSAAQAAGQVSFCIRRTHTDQTSWHSATRSHRVAPCARSYYQCRARGRRDACTGNRCWLK
jgi:hypothetical protein